MTNTPGRTAEDVLREAGLAYGRGGGVSGNQTWECHLCACIDAAIGQARREALTQAAEIAKAEVHEWGNRDAGAQGRDLKVSAAYSEALYILRKIESLQSSPAKEEPSAPASVVVDAD